MADPTYAELWNQGRALFDILEQERIFAQSAAKNFVWLEDIYTQAAEGDAPEVGAVLAGIQAFRARHDSILRGGSAVLDPWLRQMGKVIQAPERDAPAILGRLYDYMIAQAPDDTVNAREFVRGAVSAAGGNVGTGTINRLTTDDRGYQIEASIGADIITATCLKDRQSGAVRGRELFDLRGRPSGPDALERGRPGRGSGRVLQVAAVSADDSAGILGNPSFSQRGGGSDAAPTSITNWTLGGGLVIANIEQDATNFYREAVIEGGGPRALKIKATGTVSQKLSVLGRTLDRSRPYYAQIAYNRSVNGDTGTLIFRMGASSVSVVLAAQAGWNVLRIALGTGNWFDVFNEADLDIQIDWTRTGGTGLLVDDIVIAPMAQFDGVWYSLVGSPTLFQVDDSFTFTDTIAADSIIQRHLALTYGRYLPSAAAAAETILDPT